MVRIALLSDTHSFLDPKILKYLDPCDEIWHAGDIGNLQVTDALASIKPVKAVYGNIDDHTARRAYKQDLIFQCEDVKVYITHIGGYPDRYSQHAKTVIETERPQLFICGHSHILKVMYDKKFQLLHINPGACGNHGFHKIKTMIRFTIDKKEIKDLEVIELGTRGALPDPVS